eukprot:6929877-Prymnesium_polylepis.1
MWGSHGVVTWGHVGSCGPPRRAGAARRVTGWCGRRGRCTRTVPRGSRRTCGHTGVTRGSHGGHMGVTWASHGVAIAEYGEEADVLVACT